MYYVDTYIGINKGADVWEYRTLGQIYYKVKYYVGSDFAEEKILDLYEAIDFAKKIVNQ